MNPREVARVERKEGVGGGERFVLLVPSRSYPHEARPDVRRI